MSTVIAILRGNTLNLKRALRNRIDTMLERAVVAFFDWAFSKNAVQKAVAESIDCSTPIGRMLNDHIRSEIDDLDLSDKVERAVDDCVEEVVDNVLKNYNIGHDQIDGLDSVVKDVLEENTSDIVEAVMEELVNRMQK